MINNTGTIAIMSGGKGSPEVGCGVSSGFTGIGVALGRRVGSAVVSAATVAVGMGVKVGSGTVVAAGASVCRVEYQI